MDWLDDTLKFPPISARIVGQRVLTGGNATVRQNADVVEISVAEKERDPFDTIVALELDDSALVLPSQQVPFGVSLTKGARATASNTYRNNPSFGPDKAVDGDSTTRWATDAGTKSAWLEVDLGQPQTFNRVVIKQAFPELERIRKFAVEYWQDEQWKVCCHGENPGAKFSANFEPVTARRVRLNIIEATDGPTIGEFQLFLSAVRKPTP